MASTRSKHFFAGMHAGKLIANFVANPRVRRAGLLQERDQFENDIAVERQAGFSVYRRANGRIVILAERLRCAKELGDGFSQTGSCSGVRLISTCRQLVFIRVFMRLGDTDSEL